MRFLANDKPIFEVTQGAAGPVVDALGPIIATIGRQINITYEGRIDLVQLTGLPITLIGDPTTAAQTLVLDILQGELLTVPFDLSIEMDVIDADDPLEGELYCNSTFVDHLWPGGHSRANNQTTRQEIIIPGSLLVEGANTLEFLLVKAGSGFTLPATPPKFSLIPGVGSVFSEAGDAFHVLASKV